MDPVKQTSKPLQLTPEIRNEIWYNIFVSTSGPSPKTPVPIVVDDDDLQWKRNHAEILRPLLTCRQIFEEAFASFYRFNTFHFNNVAILHKFLLRIGQLRRQALHTIHINYHGADAKSAFRLLQQCYNLRYISIEMLRYQTPGYNALREVRGLWDVQIIIKVPKSYRLGFLVVMRPEFPSPQVDCEELRRAMMRPKTKSVARKATRDLDLFEKRPLKRRRRTEDESLKDCGLRWKRRSSVLQAR